MISAAAASAFLPFLPLLHGAPVTLGASGALTGPIARGDEEHYREQVDTVRAAMTPAFADELMNDFSAALSIARRVCGSVSAASSRSPCSCTISGCRRRCCWGRRAPGCGGSPSWRKTIGPSESSPLVIAALRPEQKRRQHQRGQRPSERCHQHADLRGNKAENRRRPVRPGAMSGHFLVVGDDAVAGADGPPMHPPPVRRRAWR